MIDFGSNANQVSHTFRHTDFEGLDRLEVRSAVTAHIASLESVLETGPYTGKVSVRGVRLEFRAYKFSDGNIHVGRITLC